MKRTERKQTRAVIARFIRRKWRLPLQIGAGVLVLLLIVGFAPARRHGAQAAPAGPAELSLGGAVESTRTKGVGSPFQGTLLALAVQPGQRVRKGDLLFKMDTQPYQQELAAARQERSSAAAALRDVKSEYAGSFQELHHQASLILGQMSQAQAAPAVEQAEDGTLVTLAAETVDPAIQQQLQDQLSAIRAQEAQRQAEMREALEAARTAYAAVDRRVKELESIIAQATRRSPMDGIVTGVYAEAGREIGGHQPVVRVDDPRGYRVVTLVDERTKKALAEDQPVLVQVNKEQRQGQVDKLVAGWDKELFQYWLYVKPTDASGLQPGETVKLTVPVDADQASSVL